MGFESWSFCSCLSRATRFIGRCEVEHKKVMGFFKTDARQGEKRGGKLAKTEEGRVCWSELWGKNEGKGSPEGRFDMRDDSLWAGECTD